LKSLKKAARNMWQSVIATSKGKVLVDTCVILHYLLGDSLADNAENLIKHAVEDKLTLYMSSEAYDDAITAFRSKGICMSTILDILEKWASIPHQVLPVTIEIAMEALKLYNVHGGTRKLHYFDAFHVATAKHFNLPLVTSDRYVLDHSEELGLKVIDLREIQ